MLTLRYIAGNDEESVYEVAHVTYIPRDPFVIVERPNILGTRPYSSGGTIWGLKHDGESIHFDNGQVYVMNGAGSTIAKYRLGHWATSAEVAEYEKQKQDAEKRAKAAA